MISPISVLKTSHDRQIVLMILTMLDGKTVGEICDVLDIINFYVNAAVEINYDDRIFKIDEVKENLIEGLDEIAATEGLNYD